LRLQVPTGLSAAKFLTEVIGVALITFDFTQLFMYGIKSVHITNTAKKKPFNIAAAKSREKKKEATWEKHSLCNRYMLTGLLP
jgi:hypothetical protein